MRNSILIVSLLVAAPAGARRAPAGKVLGWTADGVQLLYTEPPDEVGLGDMGGTGTVSYGVLLDGRTGLSQKYLLGSDGEVPPEDQKRLDALPKKEAWRALVAAHPTSCKPPEGVSADVTIKGKDVKGRWKKDAFEFSFGGDDMAEEKKATFTLLVKQGGKSIASATWSASQGNAAMGGALSGRIRACFGAHRVAWIVERDPGMMRDPGDWGIVIGPAGGPRIQLVADKSILAQAAAKVGAALESAGLFSTSSKASNEATPRPATVIYAAAGFEADAQRVAAAVPGGASVARLDWKTPFEIIVGIGATAMK